VIKNIQRIFKKNWLALFSLVLIALFISIAFLAPVISPHEPLKPNLQDRLKPPSWIEGGTPGYLLGTDSLGRDILSRIIYGTKISLFIGFVVVTFTMLLGTIIGSIAGYIGGLIDSVLSRIVDILLAFPFLIFALGLMAVLGPGLQNLIMALCLKGWVDFFRLVRGEVISIKEKEYVLAAKAMGLRQTKILFGEILPNVVPSLIVLFVLQIAAVIIAEASLSFLGLGIQPPAPSWGSMINDGRAYIFTSWWISTFPGLAILLLVLSISLFGEWLRDTLDPKLKDS
jgi:ABC-type dipeptide/oligopeptide/nickel transport system permease subunit